MPHRPVAASPHPLSDQDLSSLRRVSVVTITGPDGTAQHLVPAQEYLAMRDDRDNHRRAVALINAWRISPGRTEARLQALLAQVGLDDGDAAAVRAIMTGVGMAPE